MKQRQLNNEEKRVAYFSKKLNDSQKRKKAVYLECLAIKKVVQYWQHWLMGKSFTVFTDHKPLENLNIKSRTDEELGDLTYYLSQYDDNKILPRKTELRSRLLKQEPSIRSSQKTKMNN